MSRVLKFRNPAQMCKGSRVLRCQEWFSADIVQWMAKHCLFSRNLCSGQSLSWPLASLPAALQGTCSVLLGILTCSFSPLASLFLSPWGVSRSHVVSHSSPPVSVPCFFSICLPFPPSPLLCKRRALKINGKGFGVWRFSLKTGFSALLVSSS